MCRDVEELQRSEFDVLEDHTKLELAIDENDQETRRCSVRLVGLTFTTKDSTRQLVEKSLKVFAEGGIDMEPNDIKRVRPVRKTLIFDFSNWSARERAHAFNKRNRQTTKVRVQPNLTRSRFEKN